MILNYPHSIHTPYTHHYTQQSTVDNEETPLIATESPRSKGSEVIKKRLKEIEENGENGWKE